MRNEDHKTRVKALYNSEYYIALADDKYFNDAACYAQKEYAIYLQKPFLILLKKGVEIPENYFDGANIITIIEWEKGSDPGKIAQELAEKIKDFIENREK